MSVTSGAFQAAIAAAEGSRGKDQGRSFNIWESWKDNQHSWSATLIRAARPRAMARLQDSSPIHQQRREIHLGRKQAV